VVGGVGPEEKGNQRGIGSEDTGDGTFVGQVLEEMDSMGRENLRMTPRQMDLVRLAEKVCKIHGVSSGELRSGSRGPPVTSENSTLSIRSKYMVRFCKAPATMPVVSGQ